MVEHIKFAAFRSCHLKRKEVMGLAHGSLDKCGKRRLTEVCIFVDSHLQLSIEIMGQHTSVFGIDIYRTAFFLRVIAI